MKTIRDFKDTEYYEYYEKVINNYCAKIINSIMQTQWQNDIKYSWNDVLKEVYKFVNWELRDFKDDIDINQYREEEDVGKEKELIREQAKQLLWIK